MTTTSLPWSPTVMVVEDDRDSREMLCDYLERHGYRAVSAADGQEALGLLDEVASLCLILLDLMMPIMNGWQFRHEQRMDSEISKIPVVVISGKNDLPAHAQWLEADAYVQKPIRPETLLETVGRLLG